MAEATGADAHSRLLLRRWTPDDAEGFRAAVDEDVGHVKPWLSWTLEEPATLERTRARLADWAEEFLRGDRHRYAVVTVAAPDTILGGANLACRVGPDALDVGWWLRRSAAGRGIAGAAAARLIVHAFDDRDVARVVAHCDPGNERSIGFARRLGFVGAGGRTFTWPDGTPRPVLCFEMDRDGWRRWTDELRARAARVDLERSGLDGD